MPTNNLEPLVLVSSDNGLVIIENTPLTRLNYFDGKFLRASDLKGEQDYLRHLVRLSNQAGGSGVVHGFNLTLGGGDTLELGAGLAINPDGRVLLLPQGESLNTQELIDKSQALQQIFQGANAVTTEEFKECEEVGQGTPVTTTFTHDLYLIVISPGEAFCGEEDVYGKLCEEACVTSTDRPYVVEGVTVRAIPLVLKTALPHTTALPVATKLHLRSRVAAAYFEDERQRTAGMISKFGLEQQTWCLGAEAANGGGLPIGVIARAGSTTVFLDAWIARRERMDTPPRRYWQWRMTMRPWDVFLAQILQFQCQLRDVFGGGLTPGGEDPCGDARTVIGEAATKIADLLKVYQDLQLAGQTGNGAFKAKLDELASLGQKLTATEEQMVVVGQDRLLIRNGIVELPSAGYLPVAPDANASVNQQVLQWMGDGVDLRFCVVRPDYVAHALEEAQHMERISLIEGLTDAKKKPRVDILVPDGEIVTTQQADTRTGFAADAEFRAKVEFIGETLQSTIRTLPPVPFKGAARPEKLQSGGHAVHLSCATTSRFTGLALGFDLEQWRNATGGNVAAAPGNEANLGLWLSLSSDKDLLLLKPGDEATISARFVTATKPPVGRALEFYGRLDGVIVARQPHTGWAVTGDIDLEYFYGGRNFPQTSGKEPFEIYIKPQGPAGMLIALAGGRFQLAVEADWSNPASLKGGMKCTITPTPTQVFEFDLGVPEAGIPVTLTKDNGVLSPSNPNHALAVKALEYVAAPLDDETFVAEKSKLLFPPAPPTSAGGTSIRATRDWVLFHRRRDKDCGVAAGTRRYRVFEALVPSGTNRDEAIPEGVPTAEQILSFKPEDIKQFKYIGDALFHADGATPLGDLAALKSAWQKVPGGSILWAAIANRGEAVKDGEAQALARLKALQPLLDVVHPKAKAVVLPIAPPPLETPDTDGVIVFIVGGPQTYYYYYYDGYYYQGGEAAIGAQNLKA